MRTQREIEILSEVQELTDRWMGGVIDRKAWAQLMDELKAERRMSYYDVDDPRDMPGAASAGGM